MENFVTDFYRGKTILVTGATGFMGKVLVEKLLFSCTDLKHIYILIRPKRGKSVSERINEMWKLPVFSRIREKRPEAMKKLTGVDGDILNDNLGLSSDTIKKLQEEVNVVFHCAATLKLEAKLKDAIDMNTTGTWRLLQIAKGMSQLNVFVHLSTAFCYADYEKLEEKVKDAPDQPDDLMHAITWLNEKALDVITPALLRQHPNTYTYSKRLAECLVRDEYPNMRCVIARPSIVTPAWLEPVEGWVDSLNGPIGIMVGAGKGVIRTMHCNGDYHAEVIPVDYAINGLIVLASRIGSMEKLPEELPVCNLTTNDAKKTTWDQVLEMGRASVRAYPFDYPLWYPDGNIRKNELVHKMCMLFYHLIPAYFIDFIMLILGQKRFMIRIQRRITDGLELLQFFTTREWFFNNDRYKDLYDKLSAKEKKIFPLDLSQIEDNEYIKRCILGGRQYCLKEPLSTLPRARVVNNIMYALSWLFNIFFYWFLISTIVGLTETTQNFAESLPIVGRLF